MLFVQIGFELVLVRLVSNRFRSVSCWLWSNCVIVGPGWFLVGSGPVSFQLVPVVFVLVLVRVVSRWFQFVSLVLVWIVFLLIPICF